MADKVYQMEGSKLTKGGKIGSRLTGVDAGAPGPGEFFGRFKLREFIIDSIQRNFIFIKSPHSNIPGNDQLYYLPIEFVSVVEHFYYPYKRKEPEILADQQEKEMCLSLTCKYLYDKRPDNGSSADADDGYNNAGDDGMSSSSRVNKSINIFSQRKPAKLVLNTSFEEFKLRPSFRDGGIHENDCRKFLEDISRIKKDYHSEMTLERSKIISRLFTKLKKDVEYNTLAALKNKKSIFRDDQAGIKKLDSPKMNILIMIVGTRGDVQPFAQLAKRLVNDGHRVRLSSHDVYRDYIACESGLEFYPLAGDPMKLSEYIGKIQGKIIPDDLESLHNVYLDSFKYYKCLNCNAELKVNAAYNLVRGCKAVLTKNKNTDIYSCPKCQYDYSAKDIAELDKKLYPSLIQQQGEMLTEIVKSCWDACVRKGVAPQGLGPCGCVTDLSKMTICGERFHKKNSKMPHDYSLGVCSNCRVKHEKNVTFCNPADLEEIGITDAGKVMHSNLIESDDFLPDAIISNPVTYGHIHVAEALGVPLHIMFPQPWLPTKAFPHPLANRDYANMWDNINYNSYYLMEGLQWATLKTEINRFREEINLDPILVSDDGWRLLHAHRVPFVKMWSPYLAPKPKDWEDNVDVVGTFWDSPLWEKNRPPPDFDDKDRLLAFLNHEYDVVVDGKIQKKKAPKPIFVGFGSMVITDFKATIQNFVRSAKELKIRIIFQGGWAKLKPEEFGSIVQGACDDVYEDDIEIAGKNKIPETEQSTASSTWGGAILGKIQKGASYLKSVVKSSKTTRQSNFHDDVMSEDFADFQVDEWDAKNDVILIGNVNHAWLFTEVAATVHHGGAGTTAQSLRAGSPCWILPFFGDQHFWGRIIYLKGIGPKPVPFSKIQQSVDNNLIDDAFKVLLSKETQAKAAIAGEVLMNETDGVITGCQTFYKKLPCDRMVCDISLLMGISRLAHVYCKTCRWKLCVEVSNQIHCGPNPLVKYEIDPKTQTIIPHEIIAVKYADWTPPEPKNIAAATGQLAAVTTLDLLPDTLKLRPSDLGRDTSYLVKQMVNGMKNSFPDSFRTLSAEDRALYGKEKAYKKHLNIPSPIDCRNEITFVTDKKNDQKENLGYREFQSSRVDKVGNKMREYTVESAASAPAMQYQQSELLSKLNDQNMKVSISPNSETLSHQIDSEADALLDGPSPGEKMLKSDMLISDDADVNVSLHIQKAPDQSSSAPGVRLSNEALITSNNDVDVIVDDSLDIHDEELIESDEIVPDRSPESEIEYAYRLAVTLRNNFDNLFSDGKSRTRSIECDKFKSILIDKLNLNGSGFSDEINAITEALLTDYIENSLSSTIAGHKFVDISNLYLFFMEIVTNGSV